MKHTASIETLITAVILFSVACIQYSIDQQKKIALFARYADDMKSQSALSQDMAAYSDLQCDEKELGWVAIVAAGFLASSFVLLRSRHSEQQLRKSVTPRLGPEYQTTDARGE